MVGGIYMRQKQFTDAVAAARKHKRDKFKDASAKARAAKPSNATKVKRLVAKLKRENRVHDR